MPSLSLVQLFACSLAPVIVRLDCHGIWLSSWMVEYSTWCDFVLCVPTSRCYYGYFFLVILVNVNEEKCARVFHRLRKLRRNEKRKYVSHANRKRLLRLDRFFARFCLKKWWKNHGEITSKSGTSFSSSLWDQIHSNRFNKDNLAMRSFNFNYVLRISVARNKI